MSKQRKTSKNCFVCFCQYEVDRYEWKHVTTSMDKAIRTTRARIEEELGSVDKLEKDWNKEVEGLKNGYDLDVEGDQCYIQHLNPNLFLPTIDYPNPKLAFRRIIVVIYV